MSLHPEVEKMIEAGPHKTPLVHNYSTLDHIVETPEEFARRCVALAVEKERERYARIHEFEESLIDPNEAAAIRRRGKP